MLVLHLHLLLLLLCHLRKVLISWQTCQHLSTYASKHNVQHRCMAECAGLAHTEIWQHRQDIQGCEHMSRRTTIESMTGTHLKLHGWRMLHDGIARHLRPGLLHACAGSRWQRPSRPSLPRLGSWPGHSVALLRRLQPLLHVHGHGGPGQASIRGRLRGPCIGAQH